MTSSAAIETLPFEAGDPEWVADLLDVMQAGDLEVVADQLDDVLKKVRRAAKARRMLATVGPDLLNAGLGLRKSRSVS